MLAGGYYLNFSNQIHSLEIAYEGIEGEVFHYEFLNNKHNCILLNEGNIKNGDRAVFECSDSFFPFMKSKISYEVENLAEEKDLRQIIQSSALYNEAYKVYIKEDEYIQLYIFSLQENQQYKARLYEHLLIYENSLVQENTETNELIHDLAEFGYVEVSNITSEGMSFYEEDLTAQGYNPLS